MERGEEKERKERKRKIGERSEEENTLIKHTQNKNIGRRGGKGEDTNRGEERRGVIRECYGRENDKWHLQYNTLVTHTKKKINRSGRKEERNNREE